MKTLNERQEWGYLTRPARPARCLPEAFEIHFVSK